MTLWKESTNVLPANGTSVWVRRFPGIEHPKQAVFDASDNAHPVFVLTVYAPNTSYPVQLTVPAQYMHSWRPLTGPGPGPAICAPQDGTGSPIGIRLPAYVGQLYHDTSSDSYYRSTALTIADWIIIGGSTSIDPRVTDWSARVQSAGGNPPGLGTQLTLTAFLQSLDAAAVTDLIVAANCFVPDNLIAAITPLLAPTGSAAWVNHNFLRADLSYDGLRGDGINKHIDTVLRCDNIFPSPSSAGATIYVSEADNSSINVDIGVVITIDQLYQLVTGDSGFMDWETWNGYSGGGTLRTSLPAFAGLISCSRISDVDSSVYIANSVTSFTLLDTISSTGGARPTEQNIFIFGQNLNGVFGAPSKNRLSFASLHQGLTSTQAEALYAAVQAMRIGLGGGYT